MILLHHFQKKLDLPKYIFNTKYRSFFKFIALMEYTFYVRNVKTQLVKPHVYCLIDFNFYFCSLLM